MKRRRQSAETDVSARNNFFSYLFLTLCFVFTLSSTTTWAQSRTVKGEVVTEQGEPVAGAVIRLAGTSTGTTTDAKGVFAITFSGVTNPVLSVTYMGFKTQEITVGASSTLQISLVESPSDFDDLVVIGYGTAKKTDFTGALTNISSADIVKSNKQNAAAALQGTVAGVDIVKKGNNPGAGYDIMVRGQNTIVKEGKNGGDDRTALNNINPPLYVIDGMFLSSMDDIAPDDIERIDVLKDASSTAIYGSRGANGVVIVSTKRGSSGKSFVEYNGFVSVASATNLPDMMNGQQFGQYRLDRYIGQNWASYDGRSLEQVLGTNSQYWKNYSAGKSVNWIEELVETAVSQNHSVRVFGNGKGLSYTFGGGYTDDKGVDGVSQYTRYNFSSSIDRQVSKKVKTGINTYITYSKKVDSPETIRQAFRNNPLGDMYNEDGSLRLNPMDGQPTVSNPLLERENNQTETRSLHAFGNVYLEYKPLEWLKFTTTLTPDVYFDRYGQYQGLNSKTGRNTPANRRANYNSSNALKYTWNNIVSAEKTFGDHSVNAMVGTEWLKDFGDGMTSEVRGFSSDLYQFYALGKGTTKQALDSWYSQEQYMATFARLNYSYKGKYQATVTGRYDGSSKLAEGHQWMFFPSAALGWRMSEENFLKDVDAIDNLKLRLSYGKSGNNNSIGRYGTTSTIGNSYYVFGNSAQGDPSTLSQLDRLANQSLSWETTSEVNFGVDFSLLHGRINGSVDIYNRYTKDIIMDRVLPQISGYASAIGNVGEVENRGIEIGLTTVNVKTKDFSWTTNFNFATNSNEIKKLSDGKTRDEANGWFVGESVGAIWQCVPNGFWGENEAAQAALYGLVPGSIKVKENDGNTQTTNADKEIRGSIFPKWTGGVTSTFRYKDLDLAIFIYTRQGQWSYSQFHRNSSFNDGDNFNCLNLNYWTPENTNAEWHRPGVNPGQIDALMYQETSFTKIGYITLGYNLPKNLISAWGLSKLRVYGSCQNPFIFTKYKGLDPELAGQTSYTNNVMTKSFIFGANITF